MSDLTYRLRARKEQHFEPKTVPAWYGRWDRPGTDGLSAAGHLQQRLLDQRPRGEPIQARRPPRPPWRKRPTIRAWRS